MSQHHKNGHHPNGQHGATNGQSGPGQTAPAGKDGHDASGHFIKGNAGGPGNPFARKVAELRSALLDTVTPDDIRYIAGQLVVLAKSGNLAACKLLFAYVVGKPAPAVNPDGLDWEELGQRLRCPPLAEMLKTILGQFRPEHLVGLDRAMAIAQRHQLAQRIEEHLAAGRAAAAAAAPAEEAPAAPAAPTEAPDGGVESTPASRRAAAMLQQGFLKGAGLPPRQPWPGKKRDRR